MANRVARIMHEIHDLEVELRTHKRGTTYHAKLSLLERLKRDLMQFGQRYHLMGIEISFYPLMEETKDGVKVWGNLEIEKMYLTDCTQDEAVEYVKLRYRRHNIMKLTATRIPLASPIKKKKQ